MILAGARARPVVRAWDGARQAEGAYDDLPPLSEYAAMNTGAAITEETPPGYAELSEERCWVGRDVDAHPQIRLAVDVVRRDEKKNPAAL